MFRCAVSAELLDEKVVPKTGAKARFKLDAENEDLVGYRKNKLAFMRENNAYGDGQQALLLSKGGRGYVKPKPKPVKKKKKKKKKRGYSGRSSRRKR